MTFTRTILITGGTTGLGYHAGMTIAKQHPDYLIVLVSRTDRLKAADTINATLHQKNTIFLPLDLSSLANIRSFAATWPDRKFPPLQALLLNAALQFPFGLHKTADGIEATFGIAHVGHAQLFYLLFPYLADDSRIILTSSGTHDPAQKSGLPDAEYATAEELAHPSARTIHYAGRQRYASAKLTNIMWTYALNRRLSRLSKRVTVVAFDPGLMPGTGLAREAGGFLKWVWMSIMPHVLPLLRVLISHNIHSPAESGGNLARLAVGTDVQGVTGVYYEGRKVIKSSVDSYDEKKQEDLWTWTVKTLAGNEEEKRRFGLV